MLFPGREETIRGLELPWTADIFPGTGAFTTVVYTRFKAHRFGQFIYISVNFTITTNGTAASSIWISIPTRARIETPIIGYGTTDRLLLATVPTGSDYMSSVAFDNTYYGASGNAFRFSGWYEALL